MNREKVEQVVHLMMEGLDLDLPQEGLLDTPQQARSLFIDDCFRDIDRHPGELLTTSFHADYDEMIARARSMWRPLELTEKNLAFSVIDDVPRASTTGKEVASNELLRRKRTVYQEALQEARPKGRGMNPCRGFK